MEGRHALIALKGVLFFLGYCEQLGLVQIKDGICFSYWMILGYMGDANKTFFKLSLKKSNQDIMLSRIYWWLTLVSFS